MRKFLCVALSVVAIGGSLLAPAATTTVNATATASATASSAMTNLDTGKSLKQWGIELAKGQEYTRYYNTLKIKSIISSNTSVATVQKVVVNSKYDKCHVKVNNRGFATITIKYNNGLTEKITIIATNYKYSDVFKTTTKVNATTYQSTCTLKDKQTIKVYRIGKRIKSISSTGGVVNWKNYKWNTTDKDYGYAIFNRIKDGKGNVKITYTDGTIDKIAFTTSSTVSNTITENNSVNTKMIYTYNQFMYAGVINWNGMRFTYYSQSVLPGYGLDIPGRHVDGGYVRDKDGYIVIAGTVAQKLNHTVIDTPFGSKGKVYDVCPEGHYDVYVK